MKLFFILLATWFPLAAQNYPIGTANDGCMGGFIYATPQMRFGNFTCTLVAGEPGPYDVTLTFVEPNATTSGTRRFNVILNGYAPPSLQKLNLIEAGATALVPLDIHTKALSVDGKVKVQLTTVSGNAVLSNVSISPVVSSQGIPVPLPFGVTNSAVDFGVLTVVANRVQTGTGPASIFITAGPAPFDTTTTDDAGNVTVWDARIFLDQADMMVKVLRSDGVVIVLGTPPPPPAPPTPTPDPVPTPTPDAPPPPNPQ